MIHVIGQCYKDVSRYGQIIEQIGKEDPELVTIQLGNLGVKEGVKLKLNSNNYFIAGPEDDENKSKIYSNFFGSYGVVSFFGKKIMFLSGGEHTEMSYKDLAEAIGVYENEKIDIIVSFAAPKFIYEKYAFGNNPNPRTSCAIQDMISIHAPQSVFIGDIIPNIQEVKYINSTAFLSLPEFSYYTLDKQLTNV